MFRGDWKTFSDGLVSLARACRVCGLDALESYIFVSCGFVRWETKQVIEMNFDRRYISRAVGLVRTWNGLVQEYNIIRALRCMLDGAFEEPVVFSDMK